MSAQHEQQLIPKRAVTELVKRPAHLIAAIMLIGAAGCSQDSGTPSPAAGAKAIGSEVNTADGACGPPACPAHFKKNPTTGACNVAC